MRRSVWPVLGPLVPTSSMEAVPAVSHGVVSCVALGVGCHRGRDRHPGSRGTIPDGDVVCREPLVGAHGHPLAVQQFAVLRARSPSVVQAAVPTRGRFGFRVDVRKIGVRDSPGVNPVSPVQVRGRL